MKLGTSLYENETRSAHSIFIGLYGKRVRTQKREMESQFWLAETKNAYKRDFRVFMEPFDWCIC